MTQKETKSRRSVDEAEKRGTRNVEAQPGEEGRVRADKDLQEDVGVHCARGMTAGDCRKRHHAGFCDTQTLFRWPFHITADGHNLPYKIADV